jgi:hypothetical protein
MLFDLKGKRRHAVQATYLVLAVLMGGGLVLFGIGGGTSGGLVDAITGGGGSNQGNSIVEKRIATERKQLALNPRNPALLKALVRDEYTLAAQDLDPNTAVFGKDAQDNLKAADVYWQRLLATNPKSVEPALATTMVNVYGQSGLKSYTRAAQASELVAQSTPTPAAYLQLMQYAKLAGQSRKAELAGQKAIALASKSQRSSVKAAVEQLKNGTAGAPASTTGGGG